MRHNKLGNKMWLVFIPALVFIGAFTIRPLLRQEVVINSGSQATFQSGCRSSVFVIANQITRFPDSKTYVVKWQVGTQNYLTHFDSVQKELRFGIPSTEYYNDTTRGLAWHNVTKTAIQLVAQKKGQVNDLRDYGANNV